MSDLIHFAHGNGFPSPCYRQLFHFLEPRFDCCFIDKVGHSQQYPVTENWQLLIDEVLESVRSQADRPVIGLGHSLGGILTLCAAIEAPELFKCVILLDSPLIGSFKSAMIRLAKSLGIIDRVTPAQRTRGRQQYWKSRESVYRYLRSREIFKRFDPTCLDDYIDYGLEKREDGYHLRFNRHVEYLIYRTIPHILPKYLPRLETPTALIYGMDSHVVDRFDRYYMKSKLGVLCLETEGTHLFPFEYPKLASERVCAAVDAIL